MDAIIGFGSMILIVIFLYIGAGYLDYTKCNSQWEHSGLQTTWGPIKGCLVKLPDGRVIPSNSIRGIGAIK